MDDKQKLKGRECYILNDTLLDDLASACHAGMLKHTGIAIHITTIATAKHIYTQLCMISTLLYTKLQ